MTIRVNTSGETAGVTHRWYPSGSHRPFGILAFGYNGGGPSADLYFHQPAEIDEVVAELTALRADMTGEALDALAAAWPPVAKVTVTDAAAVLAASIAAGVPLAVYDDEPRCECGHQRALHVKGPVSKGPVSECNAVACGCDGFSDAASAES